MLQIQNRSENWRLAKAFINGGGVLLARSISDRVLSNSQHRSNTKDIEYELFWTGYRDYCDNVEDKLRNPELGNRALHFYTEHFNNLYENIEEYNQNNSPSLEIEREKNNYTVNRETLGDFLKNLYYTEIDIVIRIENFLLIGEVKHTQTFGSKSEHVLVHQLVRQYVMASILTKELSERDNTAYTVVPFIIANNIERNGQVRLLESLGWLHRDNIIPWESIENS